MMPPSSDMEELLEAPERRHKSFSGRIAMVLATVLAMVGMSAVVLLSQKGSTGLRGKIGGFLGLDETMDETCFEKGMFYADPHKMDGTERTVESSVEACQQRCGDTPGCAHFTYWPDGGCLITDDSSMAKAAPYKYSETVSGPAFCSQSPSEIASEAQGVVESADADAKSVESLVAPAPGVNGTFCAAYPACVAVGISEGSCCPNDDKVALGCCSGFPPKVPEVKIAAGTECSAFPACARMNMSGACCPAADGIRLSCCDVIMSV